MEDYLVQLKQHEKEFDDQYKILLNLIFDKSILKHEDSQIEEEVKLKEKSYKKQIKKQLETLEELWTKVPSPPIPYYKCREYILCKLHEQTVAFNEAFIKTSK